MTAGGKDDSRGEAKDDSRGPPTHLGHGQGADGVAEVLPVLARGRAVKGGTLHVVALDQACGWRRLAVIGHVPVGVGGQVQPKVLGRRAWAWLPNLQPRARLPQAALQAPS